MFVVKLKNGFRKKMDNQEKNLDPSFSFQYSPTVRQYLQRRNGQAYVDIFKEIDDQSCVPINPHITQLKLKTIAGGVSLFANTS
jgi:hypothetical protein